SYTFEEGIVPGHLSGDVMESGLGLAARDAGLQAAGYAEIPGGAIIEPGIAGLDLRLHRQRHPEVRSEEQLGTDETARHHAENRVLEASELGGLADCGGVVP